MESRGPQQRLNINSNIGQSLNIYKPFGFFGKATKGISYFVFGLSIFNSFVILVNVSGLRLKV